MPIDYKKYPANWKTEIRPSILSRAQNRCERCNVKNGDLIIRGKIDDLHHYYQLTDGSGQYFDADSGEFLGSDYEGAVGMGGGPDIKVVLTIAHVDHDINNNDHSNLRAWCQRCHNKHDAQYRLKNRRAKLNQTYLF